MPQRYKVFINGIPLHLCGNESLPIHGDGTFTMRHQDTDSLRQLIELVETEPCNISSVWLHNDRPEQIWKDLTRMYEYVEAAGGCVMNDRNELLLICRNGTWDLPKGHIEKGESVETAAIREVEEECGTQNLRIEKSLPSTYHTYFHKGKRVLKKTHWFAMRTPSQPLQPQTEEGITEAVWADQSQIDEALKNTYASIAELIRG